MTQNADTDLAFGMTDLEEQLNSPNGGAVKSTVLSKLSNRGQEISEKIDKGLPSRDFATAQMTYQALAAAHEIISQYPIADTDGTFSK